MASIKPNHTAGETLLPDPHLVRKSSLVFRALNHKLRQQILSLLAEKKKMTVTDLYEQLLLEQSVVSQHLAVLRRTGFVKTQKEGKFVWYMLQEKRLDQMREVLDILMS
jgi:DNA-binding transcriptional ArsR family regulator